VKLKFNSHHLKLVNVLRVQKQTTIKETWSRTDVVLRKDGTDGGQLV